MYRSKDGGKTYKKIATVRGKTSYTSKGLTAGKTYRYRICPIQGEYTGTKCVAKNITVIGKTKNLKSKVKNRKVTLTWTKVKGAKSYQIYRSANGGKTYKRIITVKGTKHVTKKMPKGKTYKYKVKAVKLRIVSCR
jgi:fibronectin type 3 domain-containing protein